MDQSKNVTVRTYHKLSRDKNGPKNGQRTYKIKFLNFLTDGFATTSNSQDDIDIIKTLVDDHSNDFQGAMPSIEVSLKKAELNIQWNELHLDHVISWLRNRYPRPLETTTKPSAVGTIKSSPIVGFAVFLCLTIFQLIF